MPLIFIPYMTRYFTDIHALLSEHELCLLHLDIIPETKNCCAKYFFESFFECKLIGAYLKGQVNKRTGAIQIAYYVLSYRIDFVYIASF